MRFYVNTNAQPNGDHEVHRSTCAWLPDVENRIYLMSTEQKKGHVISRNSAVSAV